MNKPHVHRQRRFQIRRKGELTYELAYGDRRFGCLIQDISEKGMFIICNHDLEIGQGLKVRFELEPGFYFEAKIKVRFSDDGCLGAEIIEADPRSSGNLKRFLESNYTDQSGLIERRSPTVRQPADTLPVREKGGLNFLYTRP